MPTDIQRTWKVSPIGTRGGTILFTIFGPNDEISALELLAANVPTQYGTHYIQGIDITDRVGEGAWQGEATYAPLDTQTGGGSTRFDTTGGTQHVTHALEHIADYAPSGQSAPNHNGAINVTKDGVEGCDIQIPQMSFDKSVVFDQSLVTDAWILNLASLTASTNSGTWKGYAPGTLLYLGSAGGTSGGGLVEANFRFAFSPDRTGVSIGNVNGVTKAGWDYLWCEYREEEDTGSSTIKKTLVGVHIERLYWRTDFSALGIGS